MRRLKVLFVFLLCSVVSLILPFDGLKEMGSAVAESIKTATINKSDDQIKTEIISELESFIEYGLDEKDKKRASRIPGSKAEYNSAMYIHEVLSTLISFGAVNNQSTENGVEKFNFKCVFDDKNYVSQNIIFRRESSVETNKKVVLGCHYDTSYVMVEKGVYSSGVGKVKDGINDNAAGVATLLTIAKNIDLVTQDFGFDIEIVFFGASSNNYDGSTYYTRGLSDEDAKNILLMVNFDRIMLGNYNYMYVNECQTSQGNYLFETLNNSSEFKALKNENVIDFAVSSPNGLNYTHVGLESDHAKFMARNINVLNLFSGNYEKPLTFGLSEYEGKNSITFTVNDNYKYIKENCLNYEDNLLKIFKGVNSVLFEENFIKEMEKVNNSSEWYKFWTNEKLATFITAVLLIVFIAICYLVYHVLLKRSKKKSQENDINKIIIRITKNIGEEDDQVLNNMLDEKIKDDTKENEE